MPISNTPTFATFAILKFTSRHSPLFKPFLSFPAAAARYGQWHKDKKETSAQKNVPRLLVYIMGGVTYSELRTAYEVTAEKKNWEVIIGE